MNGAESLIGTLVEHGVEVCFANPGTSEMHFVAALDEVEGMRCVLCLFEGVASGAADGYARMAGKPAATLLHLGPGLGNAWANIHNARKGCVPMINVVGDHATYHLELDAPLTSDIAGLARPVSDWVRSSPSSGAVAEDAAAAVQAAGQSAIATLILPADVSWSATARGIVARWPHPERPPVDADRVTAATRALASGKPALILLGGPHIDAPTSQLAAAIGAATGARVLTEVFTGRLRRGVDAAALERLPYLAEFALDALKDVEHLILVGAADPVSFFAYPGVPGQLAPAACERHVLATPRQDIAAALQALAADLGMAQPTVWAREPVLPEFAGPGPLTADAVGRALAQLLPAEAIVVDEGLTGAIGCYPHTRDAASHDWLTLTGGAIGWGLPAAVGAAIACPGRRVICLEGDGSAMYTLQALWTMARERLDITVILFANRAYSILEIEFARTGARGGKPGPKAASAMQLDAPPLDFVQLAHGMGVSASHADSAEAFAEQLAAALREPGPHLIEACVPAGL